MIKYLIVYNVKRKKYTNHSSFIWVKETRNTFIFCEGLPSYSNLIKKIMEVNSCLPEDITIINYLPIKPEANDLETKEVIKL